MNSIVTDKQHAEWCSKCSHPFHSPQRQDGAWNVECADAAWSGGECGAFEPWALGSRRTRLYERERKPERLDVPSGNTAHCAAYMEAHGRISEYLAHGRKAWGASSDVYAEAERMLR